MSPALRDSARVAVSLGLAVAGLGCGDGAERLAQARMAAIADNLRAQGLTAGAVACAPTSAGDPTQTATCRVEVGGVTLTVAVSPDAQTHGLRVVPVDPAVVVHKVLPEIRSKLHDAGIDAQTVVCDETLWIARAGQTQRCAVTDRSGHAFVYEATFSGIGAAHTMRVRADPTGSPTVP